MSKISSFWSTVAIMTFLLAMSRSSIVFINEPMNIAVCEGSTAIILCTYTGASTIPTWYINETNYSWLSIQKLYVLEWLYNGARITIRNVSIQINSTKYQCGFPQEDSIRSAVGILYVLPSTAEPCVLSTAWLGSFQVPKSSELIWPSQTVSFSNSETFQGSAASEPIWINQTILITATTVTRTIKHEATNSTISTTIVSKGSALKRTILITGVSVTAVMASTIITFSIITMVFIHQRKKGLNVMMESRSSPDHIYEEIQTKKQDKESIEVYPNTSYEVVSKAELCLEDCVAYSMHKNITD